MFRNRTYLLLIIPYIACAMSPKHANYPDVNTLSDLASGDIDAIEVEPSEQVSPQKFALLEGQSSSETAYNEQNPIDDRSVYELGIAKPDEFDMFFGDGSVPTYNAHETQNTSEPVHDDNAGNTPHAPQSHQEAMQGQQGARAHDPEMQKICEIFEIPIDDEGQSAPQSSEDERGMCEAGGAVTRETSVAPYTIAQNASFDLDSVIDRLARNTQEKASSQDKAILIRALERTDFSPEQLTTRISSGKIPVLLYIIALPNIFSSLPLEQTERVINNVITFAHYRNALHDTFHVPTGKTQPTLAMWLCSHMRHKSYAIQRFIDHCDPETLQNLDQTYHIGTLCLRTIIELPQIRPKTFCHAICSGISLFNRNNNLHPTLIGAEIKIAAEQCDFEGWNIIGMLLTVPQFRILKEIAVLAKYTPKIRIRDTEMQEQTSSTYDVRISRNLNVNTRITVQYNLMLLGLIYPELRPLIEETLIKNFTLSELQTVKVYYKQAECYMRHYPNEIETYYHRCLEQALTDIQQRLHTPGRSQYNTSSQ